MATMHFHIAQTGLFMGNFIFAFRGSQGKFGTNSKFSFGCKLGQIRSRGSWFEAEISLVMMIFTLFIRLSLIFLNMQMKESRIPPLDEKTCQTVSLII